MTRRPPLAQGRLIRWGTGCENPRVATAQRQPGHFTSTVLGGGSSVLLRLTHSTATANRDLLRRMV